MQPDHQADGSEERRKAPRLPEELEAVITDNAAAASLIAAMPEEKQASNAQWVADGDGREDRARRAVDVVREALQDNNGEPSIPTS